MECNTEPNLLSPIHIFRNQVAALFAEDPDFSILEIDEPLPGEDIYYNECDDCHFLNIVCSDVTKLTILRDHLGTEKEFGTFSLCIDYFYKTSGGNYTDVGNRPTFKSLNSDLDIAMLFKGNGNFSKLYSGYGIGGPWWCIAFKPRLIQYHNDDAMSLHGRRSCAMEDIAKTLFPELGKSKIYFSTENLGDTSNAAIVYVNGGIPATGTATTHSYISGAGF